MARDGSVPTAPDGRRFRRLWAVAGGVVLGFTVTACVVTLLSWMWRQSEIQRHEYRRPAQLRIEVKDTEVTVLASGRDTVTVERRLTWAVGKPVAEEAWQGDTLRLSLDCPPEPQLPGCAATYRIWVPSGLPIIAHTSSGPVRLVNLNGPVRVRTESGDVSADRLGPVSADVGTDSGDVLLEFAGLPHDVTARSTTGDVVIAVPPEQGYDVRAVAAGELRSVDVRVDPTAPTRIEATSEHGGVSIGNTFDAP
ncbi:DUF4097 family beta strand repeat-containing protein [Rhizohabitans arisaemae]|uniref:DUF4097 family beta strand repeat-containing protein n=1 Tax=Rhizohabitans arisaemae TaxID=2720610 RepID=UPI0024B24951|nr:DUF4097 family beta strand repeat-containing protein [Rhizohabitans arisaemae]